MHDWWEVTCEGFTLRKRTLAEVRAYCQDTARMVRILAVRSPDGADAWSLAFSIENPETAY
jgi:hypothetical protein